MSSLKYIISDKGEVVLGKDTYHQIMAERVAGRVVRAGHFEYIPTDDGKLKVKVFGESIGYRIQSKPEDAEIINNCTHIKRV